MKTTGIDTGNHLVEPTLTERYVHCVTRNLPESQRDDVGEELRALIAETIDARPESDMQAAEYAALAELGNPAELAARYDTRQRYLIGPRYYGEWLRWLIRIVAILAPLVAAIVFVERTMAGASGGELFGEVLAGGLSAAVHGAVWTTLGFAIAERAETRFSEGASGIGDAARGGRSWEPSDLPEPPSPAGPTQGDVWGSAVAAAIFIAALAWQHFGPFGVDEPLVNPDLWNFWLPFLIAVLIADVIFRAVLWRGRGWTIPAAALNVLLNLAFAVPVVFLAWSGQLLNPEFFTAVGAHVPGDALGWLSHGDDPSGATRTGIIVAVVVVIVGVFDVADGFLRARRASR